MKLTLRINGSVVEQDADPLAPLSEFLRQVLGLTGLKEGCCEGECGACTILMDGAPVHACLMLTFQAHEREITTVEGLGDAGVLTDLQAQFAAAGAVQCGYCTPGIIMSAEGLLRSTLTPSDEEIRHALAGNICRCTGFETIVRAVAAEAARRCEVGC